MTQGFVGLITNDNETAYREDVRDLAMWCQDSNLSINIIKTMELIVELFRTFLLLNLFELAMAKGLNTY